MKTREDNSPGVMTFVKEGSKPDLVATITALREECAVLRGQVETQAEEIQDLTEAVTDAHAEVRRLEGIIEKK